MYLHGLSECNTEWQDCVDDGPAVYQPTAANDTGYTDWINLIGQGISTWGAVEKAEQQKDVAIRTAPYQYRVANQPPAYRQTLPGSPFPASGTAGGSLFGMDTTTILMIAGIAVAGIYVARN